MENFMEALKVCFVIWTFISFCIALNFYLNPESHHREDNIYSFLYWKKADDSLSLLRFVTYISILILSSVGIVGATLTYYSCNLIVTIGKYLDNVSVYKKREVKMK
jgi:purine-cytosine permease-like protein